MTCFRPNQALRVEGSDRPIRFLKYSVYRQLQDQGCESLLQLPCGKCVGCRLDYSKSWAVRNMHESSLYEYNSFITFTYNDYFLPENGSLNYRDFTLFMKRLRKGLDERYSDYAFLSDDSHRLRFFMCGEYGSKTFRPHYHALFFNLDFSDKVLYSKRNGYSLYTSDSLSSFWMDSNTDMSLGNVYLGSLTIASCGYVSRYCTKKAMDGVSPISHNPLTGEVLVREKTNMSRKPGIAYDWFMKSTGGRYDVYPSDQVVLAPGKIYKPPRYYDNLLQQVDDDLYQRIKLARVDNANKPDRLIDSTFERLRDREKIQLAKLSLLPRTL